MTELTPQEKLVVLQKMGLMPRDERDCFPEYLTLALKYADAQKEIASLQKQIELFNQNSNEQDEELERYKKALHERNKELEKKWNRVYDLEAKIEAANKKLAEFTTSDIPNNRGNYLDELAENIHDEICKPHARNGVSWAKLVQPIIWKWWEKYGENVLGAVLEVPRKEEKNGFVKLAGLMKKENTSP
jgi:recombinational DNA repair ATPase RecF